LKLANWSFESRATVTAALPRQIEAARIASINGQADAHPRRERRAGKAIDAGAVPLGLRNPAGREIKWSGLFRQATGRRINGADGAVNAVNVAENARPGDPGTARRQHRNRRISVMSVKIS
jgi:hypothetical protein